MSVTSEQDDRIEAENRRIRAEIDALPAYEDAQFWPNCIWQIHSGPPRPSYPDPPHVAGGSVCDCHLSSSGARGNHK